MEERQESRNRAIGQLGDMFDREIAGTENGVDVYKRQAFPRSDYYGNSVAMRSFQSLRS